MERRTGSIKLATRQISQRRQMDKEADREKNNIFIHPAEIFGVHLRSEITHSTSSR